MHAHPFKKEFMISSIREKVKKKKFYKFYLNKWYPSYLVDWLDLKPMFELIEYNRIKWSGVKWSGAERNIPFHCLYSLWWTSDKNLHSIASQIGWNKIEGKMMVCNVTHSVADPEIFAGGG
jgi:hypothetical protein